MSIWIKWSDEQERLYDLWFRARPKVIRDMAERYNLRPDRLYRLKTTGSRVTLYSLDENGTVKVNVLYEFNRETMIAPIQNRRVFGIDPADLEECEWDGEVVDGATEFDAEDLDDMD